MTWWHGLQAWLWWWCLLLVALDSCLKCLFNQTVWCPLSDGCGKHRPDTLVHSKKDPVTRQMWGKGGQEKDEVCMKSSSGPWWWIFLRIWKYVVPKIVERNPCDYWKWQHALLRLWVIVFQFPNLCSYLFFSSDSPAHVVQSLKFDVVNNDAGISCTIC